MQTIFFIKKYIYIYKVGRGREVGYKNTYDTRYHKKYHYYIKLKTKLVWFNLLSFLISKFNFLFFEITF